MTRRVTRLCLLTVLGTLLATVVPSPAFAAPTPGSSTSSGSSSSRRSIALSRPSGTTAGSVMVAQVVSNDDDPGFTPPAGWTLVSDRSIPSILRQAVYYKVAGASEPTSYTWTLIDYRRVAGGITTYTGVDTTNPVDASGTSVNTGSSTAVTAPSITTTVADTLLVHLAAVNAQGSISPPAGMTERWEASSPNVLSTRDALASASSGVFAGVGATGTRAATASVARPSIATLLALRPSGPPPPPDEDPPNTTITSGPSGTVNSSSASFSFSADEPATFECRLDNLAFESCTSPKNYTNLANGLHTFTVRATDLAGNDELVGETRMWTVDAPPAPPTPSVLVGAGDIAYCGNNNDEATAKLLDNIAGTVFTIGDNVYPDGTGTEFNNCYGPTWGRHKARTLPAAGNHDYLTPGATGYYNYFGALAGDPAKGYYATTVGAWQVIVLNSNCNAVGGCGAGSAQEQWLRSVLAAGAAQCTVAIWHHPRFSSATNHGSDPDYQAFWEALYDYGAEVVLGGHDHVYERFGPQNPDAQSDAAFGIRQFTVGTGGRSHYSFGSARPNSEVRNPSTYGVLKLTLAADNYSWQFVPVAGQSFTDSGTTACHGAPAPPPPPPPPPPPTPGPIQRVASSQSGSSSSRTSITLPRPAGTVAGHVMVAQIASNGDIPGYTAPAGWSLVRQAAAGSAVRQAVYVKVAGASEPGSYTWNLPDYRRVAGGISTYSGVDTSNPVNASSVAAKTTASTSVSAPSITTTVADTMVVHFAAHNAEGSLSPPAGMTERWEVTAFNSVSTRDVLANASDAPQAAAGPTGAKVAVGTRSGQSVGILLALRPPP